MTRIRIKIFYMVAKATLLAYLMFHLDLHDVALVVFSDAVPARGVQERAGESSIVKNGFELVARYQPVPVRVAPTQ